MADTFGTPEPSQETPVQSSGNSRAVIILLVIIIIGGAVLGYLLYKQSNEPAPVLEEVTESIEIPTSPAAGTLPENTPGTVTDTPNPAE